MLESRAKHHARILVERLLGAVAVMHVEVEDRNALEAVGFERMHGSDRDVVEDAEAHRPSRRRMVPGRAHRAEGVARLARHHHVRRAHQEQGDQRQHKAARNSKQYRKHTEPGHAPQHDHSCFAPDRPVREE
jgi:hypothetical protein